MKKLYITLNFVLASTLLCAQSNDTKTADKLFDRYEYVDAAKEYLKLADNGKSDLYVESQLAESYYNIFNSKEAVKWYSKVADQKNDAETYYKYAQMLKANGDYAASDTQMNKFAALKPNDKRAVEFKNNPNYLSSLKSQSKLFDITPSDLSSDKSDFGAVLVDNNEIYFTSARNDARKTYGWNEEPFLDIYKAIYNKDGSFSEATLVGELNTKWHDGPVAVTSDGNTIYYATESFNETGEYIKDKEKRLKYGKIFLYRATKDGDKWSEGKPLPFNNKEFSIRNPAISKDGKTLYFSSDMPGGSGGEDLWKVAVNGDSYGEPVNLGNKINTEGDESFPYVTDSNVLYFTSNGLEGFGGFDVFKADLSKGGEPVNVGEPVNTEKDDFSFSFNEDKKLAFFSSNRAGVDNIYAATPVCGVNGLVVVKNAKTGAFVQGATVTIVDDSNNVVNKQNTVSNGETKFPLECEKDYAVQVSKEGFENGVFTISKTDGGDVVVTAELKPIEPIITEKEVILEPIFFEFDESNITAQGAEELDKLVQVMNDYPEMVIFVKSHTDSRGSAKYNLNLSDRRAKSTVQYVISKGIAADRISGEGFGESEPKVACDKCTEEEHSENRRSEFLIVKK